MSSELNQITAYFALDHEKAEFLSRLFFLLRNGIYPLMNFASSWPHPIPRALSLSQEQVEMVKTPTPEPQETETRKVRIKAYCHWDLFGWIQYVLWRGSRDTRIVSVAGCSDAL